MEIKKHENKPFPVQVKESKLSIESVKKSLTEIEYQVARSGSGLRIRDMPERDIRIVKGEQRDLGLIAKVSIICKGIAKDYGIRSIDKTDAFRFYDILKVYYRNLTLNEVKDAFELALVGQLDEFLPKDKSGNPDKSAYQNFSAEFVCKILNSYAKYRGKVWTKINSEVGKIEVSILDEEKKNLEIAFIEKLKGYYNDFLSGEKNEILFPVVYADYLIKKGYVKDRDISEAEIKKAFYIVNQKKTVNGFEMSSILKSMNSDKKHESIIAEAKRIKSLDIIHEAFKNMKRKKVKI